MDLVNIVARILDSEPNFNGSADPMIQRIADLSRFGARILDSSCYEVRIVDLNVPQNLHFVPFMCHAVDKMTRIEIVGQALAKVKASFRSRFLECRYRNRFHSISCDQLSIA